MIVIIDYGAGNLRSVANKLERIGVKAVISSKPSVILKAEKLILPGVGFFKAGMENLSERGLLPVLNQKVLVEKTPILGVCLGIQLFSQKSEEGNAKGLGWIEAETRKFVFEKENSSLKIPHMGWNSIKIRKKSPLLEGIKDEDIFYFVHSYHVVTEGKNEILATTHYGYDFVSVIQKDNIYGTQFHPEKSHQAGIQILKNFAKLC
ncbi:MAG: imidazole glycerol phosphate synthase subunit HisH [Patescibacteria group bacterium]|nr:imidazole glycerol phosphate synthase subunit HisH [Patescibacteria group bacterium]